MNGKIKKNIGLSLLPLGFLFLFDPNIATIDVIPDFIGYFIIYVALYNLSDMCYHIADASRGFFSAAIVSVAKLLSIAVTFGLFDSANRPVAILLFAFIFATLELIVLLPAFKRLFEGILYLGERVDCTAPYLYSLPSRLKRKRQPKRNISVRAKTLSFVFVFSRAALTVLPETTSLINSTTYRYIGLLRAFAVLISFVIGIAWLVYIFRYFAALRKDRPFVEALKEKYINEVSPRTEMFTKRTLIFALSLFSLAFAFSIDLFSDYYNFLPDFLVAAALLVFVFVARKYIAKWRACAVVSAAYGLVSAAAWGYSIYFYGKFYPEAIYKSREAYFSYYTMLGLDAASSVVMLLTVAYILFAVYKDIAVKHTGRVTLADGGFSDSGRDTELLSDIKKKLIFLWTACALGEAFSLFNVWAQPIRLQFWLLEASSIISTSVSLVCVIYCIHAISELKREIARRYINA